MDFIRFFISIILLVVLVSCGDNKNLSIQVKLAPTIFKITQSPAINMSNQESYKLEGSCSIEGAKILIKVSTLKAVSTTCRGFNWQIEMDLTTIEEGEGIGIVAEESGNSESIKIQVEKDIVLPTVSFDLIPSDINNVNEDEYQLEGSCSEDGKVSIKVGALDVMTVDCESDNDGWLVKGDVSSLTESTITIVVSILDGAGNKSAELTQIIERDVVGPSVTITTQNLDINSANVSDYDLAGACEGPSRVGITLGSLAKRVVVCDQSQWQLSDLDVSKFAEGELVVLVEQEDDFGSIGRVERRVTKDTRGATVTVSPSLFINKSNASSYQLVGQCEGSAQVSVTIGSGQAQTITCANSAWSHTVDSTLAEGNHTLGITQQDEWGNTGTVSPSPVLRKDVTDPTFGFSSNLNIDAANKSQYRVSGTCNERGVVTVTVGSLSPVMATCNGITWRTGGIDASNLVDAPLTLRATMVDEVGNEAAEQTASVTKSIQAIALDIDALSVITSTNKSSYTVSGTCSNHAGSVSVTLGGSVSETASCSNGEWSASGIDASVFNEGAVSVAATLSSGGDQATDSDSVLKDTIVPVVAIAANQGSLNAANQASYTLRGTCDESGQEVSVTVAGLGAQKVSCDGTNWVLSGYDASSATSNTVSITADMQDAAGNAANQATLSVERDVDAPVVSLITTDIHINAANEASYSLTGACETGLDVLVTVGSSPQQTLSCAASAWSLTGYNTTSVISEGIGYSLIIGQVDGVNNAAGVRESFDKDVTVPTVSLGSGLFINAQNESDVTLRGSCSENRRDVDVTLGTDSPVKVFCRRGSWVYRADLSSKANYPEGDISVTLAHTDSVGNAVSATDKVKKDTVLPTFSFGTNLNISAEQASQYRVSGSCDENGTVTVTVANLDSVMATCNGSTWQTAVIDSSGLLDGSIILRATMVDEAGNGASEKTLTISKNTMGVAIGSLVPINLLNETSYSVSGTCSSHAGSVSVIIGQLASVSAACSNGMWSVSNINVNTLGDGSLNVMATFDSNGDEVSHSRTVQKDTIVPVVAIAVNQGSLNAANQASYTVRGTCDESGGEVSVTVAGLVAQKASCDGTNWVLSDYDALSATGNTVSITADMQDAAGNAAIQATLSVERDVDVPVVSLTTTDIYVNAANEAGYSLGGTCETGLDVLVTVETLSQQTLSCTNSAWSLTSYDTSGLVEGTGYNLVITQTDGAGNEGRVTQSFDKDVTVPTVTLNSFGPINMINESNISLTGNCSEQGQNVELTIGNASSVTVSCGTGGWTYLANLSNNTNYPQGEISVTLSHADSVGNIGLATGSVSKDTVVPTFEFATGLNINIANIGSYRVSGTCNESGTVTVKVGNLSSVTATCNGSTWQTGTINVNGLADGNITLRATMVDVSGNTASEKTSIVIKEIRTLTLDTLVAINSTNETNYSVSGTCSSHTGNVSVVIEGPGGSGGSVSVSAACSNGTWSISGINTNMLSDGNVSIMATFGSGGAQVSASGSVNKNTVVPVITVSSSLTINSGNVGGFQLGGNCVGSENVSITIGSGQAQTVSCSSTTWLYSVNGNLAEGNHELVITQVGQNGNIGTIDPRPILVKDTIAPVVSLTTTDIHVNAANEAGYSLGGACETGLDVLVTVETLSQQTLSCTNSAWSLTSYDTSGLGEGTGYNLVITQTDGAGNEGRVTQSFDKDVRVPTVTLNSFGPISTTNESSISLTGNCSEQGQNVELTIGNASSVLVSCGTGGWTHLANLSNDTNYPQGEISVTLSHADSVGNIGLATGSVSKDTVVPTFEFATGLNINIANIGSYRVSGTCNESGTVTVTVGTLSSVTATCDGVNWRTAVINVSSLADGNITLKATMVDGVGNTTLEKANTIIKDLVAPVVAINALTFVTDLTSYSISGTCSENTRTVSLRVESQASQASCQNNQWTHTVDISGFVGSIPFRASQVDAGGNTGLASEKTLNRWRYTHQKLGVGLDHTCVIMDGGGVKCWGGNSVGELGDGTNTNRTRPVDVTVSDGTSLTGVVMISSMGDSNCALTEQGGAKCWGDNQNGELGDGTMGTDRSRAVDVVEEVNGNPLTGMVFLASGGHHTCAVTRQGRVKCWGWNNRGQLGNGGQISSMIPVDVVLANGDPLTDIVAISLGNIHSCALTRQGGVKCWGANNRGQLGDGNVGVLLSSLNPVDVTLASGNILADIVAIDLGNVHSCAVTRQGGVKCWGENADGRLGDGTFSRRINPVDVLQAAGGSPLMDIVSLSLGLLQSCAVTRQGGVKCWGSNNKRQLGNGYNASSSTPISVIAGKGATAELRHVVALGSSDHSCVLIDDGRIKCWGDGDNSKLGNGNATDKGFPVTVRAIADDSSVLKISTYLRTYNCIWGVCSLDPIIFSLAGTSSSPSSSDADPEIGIAGLVSGQNINLYSDSTCQTSVGSATSSDATVDLTGITEGIHRYYYTITASSNTSDCSVNSISYILDQTDPIAPTLAFDISSGTDTTPNIIVSGVISGDLVKIYSDSSCITSAGPTKRVDRVSQSITVTAITGGAGNYTYYATVTDWAGRVSSCSSGATYTLSSMW